MNEDSKLQINSSINNFYYIESHKMHYFFGSNIAVKKELSDIRNLNDSTQCKMIKVYNSQIYSSENSDILISTDCVNRCRSIYYIPLYCLLYYCGFVTSNCRTFIDYRESTVLSRPTYYVKSY